MDRTAEGAGFFAAHAVWCVSDEDGLTPILAHQAGEEAWTMMRLDNDELAEAVEAGHRWISQNPEHAARAVLIYDGYITLSGRKYDALLVELHVLRAPQRTMTVAIPYRKSSDAAGFAVYRPKFYTEASDEEARALADAFWRGVDRHEDGSKVWNKSIVDPDLKAS